MPTATPTAAPTAIPSSGPTPMPTTPGPTTLPTALPSPLPSASPSPLPSPLPTPHPTKVPTVEEDVALGMALGMGYFMLGAMLFIGILVLKTRRRHYLESKMPDDSSSLRWWCTNFCPSSARGDSPLEDSSIPEPTLGFDDDGMGETNIAIDLGAGRIMDLDGSESKAGGGSFDAKVEAAAAAAAGTSSFDEMVEAAATAAAAESAASAALDEDSTEEAKRAAQAVLDAEIELLKVRMEARDAEIERLRTEMSAPPPPPPLDPAVLDLAELEARGWSALNAECKRRGLPDRGPTRELARRLKEAAALAEDTSEA